MAIIKTINSTAFSDWIEQSNDYKNNFTYEGANALQQYLKELSDDIGENIDFDPVAWCCEYSEYASVEAAYLGCTDDIVVRSKKKMLEYLEGRTTVIKIDNSKRIILGDF